MAELVSKAPSVLKLLQSTYTTGFPREFEKEFVTSLLVPLMSFLQEVRVELIGTIFPEEKIVGAENHGPGKVTLHFSAKWRNGKGICPIMLGHGRTASFHL